MGFILSSNMSLPIPGVGTEPGPNYAFDVNSALTIIDAHDHTPGNGVQITPSGLNINTVLTFSNNFATNLAGVTFFAQGSTPANGTIYESGVDLYYVDGVGNNVRITQSGSVAGAPGSISNLAAPASASYVSGSSTFVWQSNTNIAANMDFGAAVFRNLSPNSTFGITVQAPAGLASNYSVTLPALPAATSLMTLSSTGALSTLINGSLNQVLISTGTGTPPTYQTLPGNAGPLKAITAQKFITTPTQSGWLFTISTTTTVAAGDTYTNNANTFTVLKALTAQSGSVLFMSGTGSTSGSALTRVSGAGTASITFSTKIALGDYTVPSGPAPLYLKVRMVAGGGGGAAATTNNGAVGKLSSFAFINATGGGGGSITSGSVAAGGSAGFGVASGNIISVNRFAGTSGDAAQNGGIGPLAMAYSGGGASVFGGAGAAGTSTSVAGGDAADNSGSGGGGNDSGTGTTGGGAAGEYVEMLITSPSGTYPVIVATGGNGGSAGTRAGGNGAAGLVLVEEYYQ